MWSRLSYRVYRSAPGRRSRSLSASWAADPFTSVGRLGRAYSRPFLDLFLFTQNAVDFCFYRLDALLLPASRRLSVLDKALDQQVLKFDDPRPLLPSYKP